MLYKDKSLIDGNSFNEHLSLFKMIKQCVVIVLAGLLSLAALTVFTLLYNYTGIHIANSSGATDYIWDSGQLKTNMVEGFAWFKMDDKGFNNMQTLSDGEHPDILLMGSSHMEAVQVAKNENTGYLMNEMIPEFTTYNIGISGHTIYRCARNLKSAVAEYEPSDYVVIETSTVRLESDSINKVLNNTLDVTKSYDNGVMYLTQKYCPAVKSLFKQIQDWRSSDNTSSSSNVVNMASADEENAFVSKMKGDCGDARLIICYQPLYNINEDGELVFKESRECVEAFARHCEDSGIIFVDMTASFIKLYEQNHILAHGFINTAVGEGHLNKYCHKAIAEAVAAVIKEDAR